VSLAAAARLSPRRGLGLWLAAGAVAGVGFLLLGWSGLPVGHGFTICAFRRVTGIPCPGCGMTRAMVALARGELVAALHLHPFAPLLLGQAAAWWGALGAALWRQRPFTLPARLLERLLVWQGAAFLALWLGRLATGTLPW